MIQQPLLRDAAWANRFRRQATAESTVGSNCLVSCTCSERNCTAKSMADDDVVAGSRRDDLRMGRQVDGSMAAPAVPRILSSRLGCVPVPEGSGGETWSTKPNQGRCNGCNTLLPSYPLHQSLLHRLMTRPPPSRSHSPSSHTSPHKPFLPTCTLQAFAPHPPPRQAVRLPSSLDKSAIRSTTNLSHMLDTRCPLRDPCGSVQPEQHTPLSRPQDQLLHRCVPSHCPPSTEAEARAERNLLPVRRGLGAS